MRFEYLIAQRYLRTSIINKIAMIVVTIGTFLIVVVLSVMNGFEWEVKDRIIGHNAHVTIRKYKYESIDNYESLAQRIRSVKDVLGVSPVIMEKVGLDSRDAQEGAMCVGIDPVYAAQTTKIQEYIKWGGLFLDSTKSEKGKILPGVVLGAGLANRLRISVGDEIFLLSFQKLDDLYSSIIPRVKRFCVCALYESGYNEFDANYAMIGLKQAQELFMMENQVNAMQVKIRNMYNAPRMAEEIKKALGDNSYKFYVTHWIAMNSMLFKWIKLEKLIMFCILSAYIFLAALSIVSSLTTIVISKTREIGILKSMGASDRSMIFIFVFQGLIVGLKGSVAGLFLSLLPCLLQQFSHLIPIPSDIYFIDYVPMIVSIWDILLVLLSVNTLCLIATIIPAYKAAHLLPAESLRYEL